MVIRRLARLCYSLSNILLIIISFLIIVGIVIRQFNLGIRGPNELSILFAIWLSFLLIGNLMIDGRHIRIDYFRNKLGDGKGYYVDLIVDVLSLVVIAILLYSTITAVFSHQGGASPELGIPTPVYYSAPILGLSIAIMVLVKRLYENVRGGQQC